MSPKPSGIPNRMEIKLTLALPRDRLSVPAVRKVLGSSLGVLGVHDEVISDIGIALSEACTNVVDHATEGDEYEVSVGIRGNECVIEVVDTGGGFDGNAHGLEAADHGAEGGRGIQIMRALVDKVSFHEQRQSDGTMVHLEKRLTWDEGSVIGQLTDGQPEMQHGPWSGEDLIKRAPGPE